MLAVAVLLSILFGWMMGGKLRRLERIQLFWLPLPIGGLLLEWAIQPLTGILPWPPETWVWFPVWCSYLCLLLFLLKNSHLRRTAVLAGSGTLCNLAVITANGMRMPVSQKAAAFLSAEGLSQLPAGEIPTYMLANDKTRLLFLGDILPLPGGFASIGDLLLAAGIFFCIMAIMSPVHLPKWWKRG